MPDQIQSYKLVCSGGLNSNENHLDLSDNSPGAATRLVNYEPGLFGGYRRIAGYDDFDTDYGEVTVDGQTTGQGKVLGLAIFKDDVLNTTKIIRRRFQNIKIILIAIILQKKLNLHGIDSIFFLKKIPKIIKNFDLKLLKI